MPAPGFELGSLHLQWRDLPLIDTGARMRSGRSVLPRVSRLYRPTCRLRLARKRQSRLGRSLASSLP